MSKTLTEIQPKRIRSLKQAKRLMADYIYLFQQNPKERENELKTIVYALIKYAELCKIEEAIKHPEDRKIPPIEINVRQ
jgi:hypothetical protein